MINNYFGSNISLSRYNEFCLLISQRNSPFIWEKEEFPLKYWIIFHCKGGGTSRDGNREGWGRIMGSSPPLCMVLSYSITTSTCMTRKTSLSHPHPMGPTPPCKIYFVLICTTIITISFNKTCFININILEIATKFI